MKVVCPKCKESKFSVLENRCEEINYKEGTGRVIKKEGTGRVIKDLSCDFCGAVFLANMNIEVSNVDIDFVIS